jgi:hypothetical protein
MLWLLKKAVERLKTLLVTDAALDLEAAFFARQADRRADLLKEADEYETQSLHVLAEDLRRQAEELSIERPLASVLPAFRDLTGNVTEAELPRLEALPGEHQRLMASNGTARKISKPKTSRKKSKAR